MRQLTQIIVLGLTFVFGVSTASGQKIYFSSWGGGMARANLDGTEVEFLVATDEFARAIALDLEHEKLYWTDPINERIRRANLDGSDAEDVLTGVQSEIGVQLGIALDVASGKMYFTNSGTIQRANLDGSEIEDVVATEFAWALALDLPDGKIYWTDPGKIQRANLDGTQIEELITDLILPPAGGIALDPTHGKVYWASNDLLLGNAGRIERANLDGSEVEDVIAGPTLPWGIALDLTGGKLYFTDRHGAKVKRANLDGSDVQDLVTGIDPLGIALDLRRPVPIPTLPEWGLITMAVLLLAAGIVVFRRRCPDASTRQLKNQCKHS